MGCYSGKELAEGLNIFKDSFRTTGDFYKSSVKAVQELNDRGIDIKKIDFDLYVRENFIDVVNADQEYYNFRTKKNAEVLEKVQKELGIGGRYAMGKPGEFKVGKLDIETQEKFQRLKDAYLANDPYLLDNEGEMLLVQSILDGRNYQDTAMLQEALESLKEIRETGKSKLEEAREKKKEKQKKLNEKVKSDFDKLSHEQQALKKIAARASRGENVKLDEMIQLAKEMGIKILPENYDNDSALIGKRIIQRLNRSVGLSRGQKLMYHSIKVLGEFMLFSFHDMRSTLNSISLRGNKSTTRGIAKTIIYDDLKQAEGQIILQTEQQTLEVGRLLAAAYDIEIPNFKGNKAIIKESDFFMRILKEKGLESAIEFDTGLTNDLGESILLSKGDLMQLYIDSINPNVAESMKNAGIDSDTLKKLVNDKTNGLTEQDRAFAVSLVSDFYPKQWEKENTVYRRVYNTNMPRIHNYAGPVSFDTDLVEDNKVTPDTMTSRRQTNVTLANARVRRNDGSALNLNRNIYSNVLHRINNSSKFIGGAETYSRVKGAIDASRNILKRDHVLNYHGKLTRQMDAIFGMNNNMVSMPKLINALKGNFAASTLAFKPKLMFNQTLSSTTWLIEDSFWNGVGTKPQELQGVNISKLLYDISPILRERYKGKNIIALDAQIEASAYTTKEILGAKSKLQNGIDGVNKIGMSLIANGDKVGVMMFGRNFFIGEYKRFRKDGMDHDAAQAAAARSFERKFTSTQQSFSKLDRSDLQNHPFGSIFTMFQTTPYQYGREVWDAADQTIRAIRGKESKGSIGYNVSKIAMFHSVAGASYWFATKGLVSLVYGGWDEDDWEELWKSMYRGPWLTAIWIFGDIIDDAFNFFDEVPWESPAGQATAFSTLQKMQTIWKRMAVLYMKDNRTAKEEETLTELQWEFAATVGKLRGVAMDQFGAVYDIVGNVLDGTATKDDLFRAAGYSEWQIREAKGENKKKKKKPKKGSNPLRSGGSSGSNPLRSKKKKGNNPLRGGNKKNNSPLRRGGDAEILDDGTIKLNPKLKGAEKLRAIAHEMQHKKDMEKHGLDYDDNNVYFKGKSYARKNGKIEFNGKMVKEGDRSLPWEQRAYAAESSPQATSKGIKKSKIGNQSPLKRDPDDTTLKSQKFLNKHNNAGLTEDGIDGPNTRNAVESYIQNTNFLDRGADALSSAFDSVKEFFTPEPEKDYSRYHGRGSWGNVQKQLVTLGYDIKPDGKFGPNTKGALSEALGRDQRVASISPTGIAARLLPTNLKLFGETVVSNAVSEAIGFDVGKTKELITNRDYKTSEIRKLQEHAADNIFREGRYNVGTPSHRGGGYRDYETESVNTDKNPIVRSFLDGDDYRLRTILGAAGLAIDDDGMVYSTDAYDFNPNPTTGKNETYASARDIGGKYIPPGKGRPNIISLGHISDLDKIYQEMQKKK